MKSNDVAKANEEETKTFPTNFNKKPHKNINILLQFLLITKALFIAANVYCCLKKYQAKQLLPLHYTNNELRDVFC